MRIGWLKTSKKENRLYEIGWKQRVRNREQEIREKQKDRDRKPKKSKETIEAIEQSEGRQTDREQTEQQEMREKRRKTENNERDWLETLFWERIDVEVDRHSKRGPSTLAFSSFPERLT